MFQVLLSLLSHEHVSVYLISLLSVAPRWELQISPESTTHNLPSCHSLHSRRGTSENTGQRNNSLVDRQLSTWICLSCHACCPDLYPPFPFPLYSYWVSQQQILLRTCLMCSTRLTLRRTTMLLVFKEQAVSPVVFGLPPNKLWTKNQDWT